MGDMDHGLTADHGPEANTRRSEMVLKGQAAVGEMHRVAGQLDKYHRRFALFAVERPSAALHILRSYECGVSALAERSRRLDPPDVLLQNIERPREGLRYALLWAHRECPLGALASLATDQETLDMVPRAIAHGADYWDLCVFHRSVESGLCKVEYDAERRSFRFSFVDENVRVRMATRWSEDAERMQRQVAEVGVPPEDALTGLKPYLRQTGPYAIEIDLRILERPHVGKFVEAYTAAMAFDLPGHWNVGAYTLEQFRKAYAQLAAFAQVSAAAHLLAPQLGLTSVFPYDSCVPVKSPDEWVDLLARQSGVKTPQVAAVVADLTWSTQISNPEPALQPFVPLDDQLLALSVGCVGASNPERNLLKVINRLPEKRTLYTALSSHKEALFRTEVTPVLKELGLRFVAEPTIADASGATCGDVDLLVWQPGSGTLLLTQLKWLIGPHEFNEVLDHDREFEHGVTDQVIPARDMLRRDAGRILAQVSPEVDPSAVKLVLGLVLSRDSTGSGRVFAPDVPVIDWPTFRQFLYADSKRGLKQVHRRCVNRPDRRQRGAQLVHAEREVQVGEYTYVLPAVRAEDAD